MAGKKIFGYAAVRVIITSANCMPDLEELHSGHYSEAMNSSKLYIWNACWFLIEKRLDMLSKINNNYNTNLMRALGLSIPVSLLLWLLILVLLL